MDAFQRSHQLYIAKLCGSECIPVHDSFWVELVHCSTPLTSLQPSSLQAFLSPFSEQLAKNNAQTKHYGALLIHTVEQLGVASSDRASVAEILHAANAIVLLQILTVQLLSILPPQSHREIVLASSSNGTSPDPLSKLVVVCLQYIQKTTVNSKTYALYCSILSFLITCLSSQLYHADANLPGLNVFMQTIQEQESHSAAVISKLLENIVKGTPMAPTVKLYTASSAPPPSTSIVGAASRIASDMVIAPAWALASYLLPSPLSADSPVADSSLSLLLLLLHQDSPNSQHLGQSFHGAFKRLQNADSVTIQDAEEGSAAGQSAGPSVCFSALFDCISGLLSHKKGALLLYSLLTRSHQFRQSVLVRSDIDALILPLLEQLHAGTRQHINHLYILLIILLVLSQDEVLAMTAFKVRVSRLPWFVERGRLDLSLGDIMLSVLLKVALRNTSTGRDEYMHSNALSALINLAPHATNLSSSTTQRLCFTIEGAHKRLCWLDRKVVESVDRRVYMQERQLLQDYLRNVIIVLDSLIYRTLPKNPELVYSLLHQQATLKKLSEDDMWEAGLQNAMSVVRHFNECVDSAQRAAGPNGGGDWGVAQVMLAIQRELLVWKRSSLKAVADTQCTYEEAPQASEFFAPYVWFTVLSSPHMSFFPQPRAVGFAEQCNATDG